MNSRNVECDHHGVDSGPFTYIWYWRKRLPERKGQRCRLVAVGRLNSVLVEFEDGWKVITSRYAIRRIKS